MVEFVNPASPTDTHRYRIGAGILALQSDDREFAERFLSLFGECGCPPSESASAFVTCKIRVQRSQQLCTAEFEHPVELPLYEFLLAHGDDLGLAAWPRGEHNGWQTILSPAPPHPTAIAVRGRQVRFKHMAWQGTVAQVAVNNVIRLQPGHLFFHAATVVTGSAGVFISGEKESGKTTLALALAGAGFAFLGDEYAAIDATTREILPVRRAVSIRPGLWPSALEHAVTHRHPDGRRHASEGWPLRMPVGQLFPNATALPGRLTHAFFLRGRSVRPRLEPFRPGRAHIPTLRPLKATLWGHAPGRRLIQLLQLFGGVRCYHLDVGGTPDETADLIRETVERTCPLQ